jgi:hypothetical protein
MRFCNASKSFLACHMRVPKWCRNLCGETSGMPARLHARLMTSVTCRRVMPSLPCRAVRSRSVPRLLIDRYAETFWLVSELAGTRRSLFPLPLTRMMWHPYCGDQTKSSGARPITSLARSPLRSSATTASSLALPALRMICSTVASLGTVGVALRSLRGERIPSKTLSPPAHR